MIRSNRSLRKDLDQDMYLPAIATPRALPAPPVPSRSSKLRPLSRTLREILGLPPFEHLDLDAPEIPPRVPTAPRPLTGPRSPTNARRNFPHPTNRSRPTASPASHPRRRGADAASHPISAAPRPGTTRKRYRDDIVDGDVQARDSKRRMPASATNRGLNVLQRNGKGRTLLYELIKKVTPSAIIEGVTPNVSHCVKGHIAKNGRSLLAFDGYNSVRLQSRFSGYCSRLIFAAVLRDLLRS